MAIVPKENIPNIKPQNFEVHTMPQKFLATRPASKQVSSKKPHKPMGLKNNLIIGAVVIIIFAGLLMLAAWLFLRSFNEPATQLVSQKQVIPATLVTDTKNVSQAPTATTTLDNLVAQKKLTELLDYSKWQMTTNDIYSYTLKFPVTWQLKSQTASTTDNLLVLQDENKNDYFSVLVTPQTDKMTLEDWLTTKVAPLTDFESFTLSGQLGYQLMSTSDRTHTIFMAYKNNFYKLLFIKNTSTIADKLNNALLINFKFIKTKDKVPNPAVPVYVPATDSDHDGLTDVEELLYGTDKLKRDTDGDSYIDGEEISNLYDPTVVGSAKIYERSVVTTYVNNNYGYNLIYPATWEVKTTDNSNLFQDKTGEFIQVLILSNDKNYSDIINWYKANINLDVDNLTHMTVDNLPAIRTIDGYTVYFLLGDNVYTLLYNINLRQDANFMTTFDMVIKSFKLMPKKE